MSKARDEYNEFVKNEMDNDDIYGGWVDGHGTYCNGANYYIHQEGRWRAWARKI